MPLPKLTERMVRSLASPQSFARGQDYYDDGAVLEVILRGEVLHAQVEGSEYDPYQVRIEFSGGEIASATCTCPYDWGGYCKHIVAVLLTAIHEPETVEERPPVAEMLNGLERETLLKVLNRLMEEQPELVNRVETILFLLTAVPQPSKPHHRRTPLDVTPIRRQANAILHPRDSYWGIGSTIANEMQELMDKALPYIEGGDGRNALLILEAMTEPLVASWFEYDEEGEVGALFVELGQLFAEAILSTDLTTDERRQWARKLTAWQGEIEEYGIDEGFDVAIAAAKLGWDYPPLQAVLRGEITDKGAWEDEAPWYADDLAQVRLRVLEREGRTTEYLYLAEAEGQIDLYLTMLVKLGRSHEAVDYALQYLTTTEDALTLAQSLAEHNHRQDALKIAEHGLSLQGQVRPLARWLRDFAARTDHPNRAIQAARLAFEHSCSLEDYQAAQEVAGDQWPSLKPALLETLARSNHTYGKIDIYLYEGMIDEAIQTVDAEPYIGYYTLEPVVEAAWKTHPHWVIRQCTAQAERIMDEGKSKYYHHAIRWLERARRAFLHAGEAEEWNAYLEGLIQKHYRKYSLRPRLEELRQG